MKLDPDIDPEIANVLETAALLDTTEFNVFRLAYVQWFGRSATTQLIEPYFNAYMFHEIVPFWVHHFTRQVIQRYDQGRLDPEDYGLTPTPISAKMILIGRAYTIVLIVVLVALFMLTVGSEHLRVIAENCYFPPCY